MIWMDNLKCNAQFFETSDAGPIRMATLYLEVPSSTRQCEGYPTLFSLTVKVLSSCLLLLFSLLFSSGGHTYASFNAPSTLHVYICLSLRICTDMCTLFPLPSRNH